MLIDEELRTLLESGEIADRIQFPVEVALIRKSGEQHLIAFVGGTPVFQSTYSNSVSSLEVRAAIDYIRKNLWSAVFATISIVGHEAVQLPGYEKRKKVALLWAEEIAKQTKAEVLRRQQDEISRVKREAASLRPVLKDHRWRADLLSRSLTAIAELRQKKRPVSQKTVAPIVYDRREVHQLESASAQYWRELKEGFGRPASKTFEALVGVKKTWDELTSNERSELNCPESSRINRKSKKSTSKKVRSV